MRTFVEGDVGLIPTGGALVVWQRTFGFRTAEQLSWLVNQLGNPSLYSAIRTGTASQATPRGQSHERAGKGFEMAIKL